MVLSICNQLYHLVEKHTELVQDQSPRTFQENIEHLNEIETVAEEIQKLTKQVNNLLPHLR